MWLLLPLACAPEPDPTAVGGGELTLRSYTETCEAVLGPLPDLRCDDGVIVPITVTGPDGVSREVHDASELEGGTDCDRPSPISGCTPGSRAGSVRTERAVFHFVCRRNDPDTPDGLYDDIALIGHDPVGGAACFWGAAADGVQRDGSLPHPASDAGQDYWASLPELAELRCRSCHDADPIVVTPWIAGAGVIDNDPLAPFVLVGEAELEALSPGWWRPGRRLVHPDAAPCTACHDLTDQAFGCRLSAEATGVPAWRASEAAQGWPLAWWMDSLDPDELAARYPDEAAWQATYGVARETVLDCCSGELSDGACWESPQSSSRSSSADPS